MKSQPTSEEITCNKKLIRHYQTQIYKLNRQQRYLLTQLDKIKAQLKDYQKAKEKTEKWLAGNR